MAAKAVENAGTGAASIDEYRRSAPPCHLGRIDTERSPAPIDMRVEIDQPGHDEQSAHIDDLSITGPRVAPDFGHLSVAESDVSRLVAPARRVDDTTASENQIRHTLAPSKNLAVIVPGDSGRLRLARDRYIKMAFVNFGKERDAVSRSQTTQWPSASPVRSFTARYVKVVTSGRTPPRCCATMRRISKGARCSSASAAAVI